MEYLEQIGIWLWKQIVIAVSTTYVHITAPRILHITIYDTDCIKYAYIVYLYVYWYVHIYYMI